MSSALLVELKRIFTVQLHVCPSLPITLRGTILNGVGPLAFCLLLVSLWVGVGEYRCSSAGGLLTEASVYKGRLLHLKVVLSIYCIKQRVLGQQPNVAAPSVLESLSLALSRITTSFCLRRSSTFTFRLQSSVFFLHAGVRSLSPACRKLALESSATVTLGPAALLFVR